MAGGQRTFVLQPLRQQDLLDDVELRVLPRQGVLGEIALQQPVIDERLVLLVREVRLDDRREELGVLLEQEEA